MSDGMPHVVAVVDDDSRMLESLEDLLESAGYDVHAHCSGSSLLASTLADIHCLIADIGMPVMDGFELRDEVKRIRPELPVLLISGRCDLADLDKQGGTEIFRKPFDGPVLLAAIGKVLSQAENE